jgi:hypothetical protein
MSTRTITDSSARAWTVVRLYSALRNLERKPYSEERVEAWSVFSASHGAQRAYFRAPNAAFAAEDAAYLLPLIESGLSLERRVPHDDAEGWHFVEAESSRTSAVSGSGPSPLDRVHVRCEGRGGSFELELPVWWRSPLEMSDDDLLMRISDEFRIRP